MPYIFTVFINLFIFLKLKNYQCFRCVRLRQNISTLAGETIDINKRLRYWALVCMSFRSACYSTFCPYVSPADVSQMGRGNSPTSPNSKTRPRKFTCNNIKPSTSNMCYKDYFWRGWKLCSLYKFIFYFINEAKNFAFASNCFGKFNNIENILALLKSLDF